MSEFLLAFLTISAVVIAVKIIHQMIQVFTSMSILLIIIVFILLVSENRDLQIPFYTNEIKPTIMESYEEVEIRFKDLIP